LAVLQAIHGGRLHTWLAVFAVLFSLIGAFYYLRMVKLMYFDAPTDTAPPIHGPSGSSTANAPWLRWACRSQSASAGGTAAAVFGSEMTAAHLPAGPAAT
jgi:hypothetical protein